MLNPVQAFLDRLAVLVQTDTTFLDQAADALLVHLSKSAFTPGPSRVIGDFTEADFDGYAALEAGTGTPQRFLDPVTGLWMVQILEPVGGWNWITTGLTNLPQTIYGCYLTLNDGTTLVGCQRFGTQVVLTTEPQGINIDQVAVALSLTPFVV